jgi:hypothetical protein
MSAKIKILSWNINNDRRVESGYAKVAFDNWTFAMRFPEIIRLSVKENPTIISFCEIDANYVEQVKQKLGEHGYKSVSGAYSPNQIPDGSMYFVTAYKSVLELVSFSMFWFTSSHTTPLTPETRMTDDLLIRMNEQYEKGSLITYFKKPDGTFLIHSANHWGLREAYQKIGSDMLASFFEGFLEVAKIIGIKVQVVLSGDFNTFSQLNGKTIAPLSHFNQHIDPVTKFSFVNYPYDLGLKVSQDTLKSMIESYKTSSNIETRKLFMNCVMNTYGQPIVDLLDHVFTYGIENANYRIETFDVDIENLSDSFIKSVDDDIPFMMSDHFPTIIEF